MVRPGPESVYIAEACIGQFKAFNLAGCNSAAALPLLQSMMDQGGELGTASKYRRTPLSALVLITTTRHVLAALQIIKVAGEEINETQEEEVVGMIK